MKVIILITLVLASIQCSTSEPVSTQYKKKREAQGTTTNSNGQDSAANTESARLLAKGKTLYTTHNCGQCHSPITSLNSKGALSDSQWAAWEKSGSHSKYSGKLSSDDKNALNKIFVP